MTETNQPPEICPKCQAKVLERKGVSKKTGKPYAFYGCTAYPNCDFIWHPPTKEDRIIEMMTDLNNAIRIVNDNVVQIAEGVNKLLKK